jgi:hypothetical protein
MGKRPRLRLFEGLGSQNVELVNLWSFRKHVALLNLLHEGGGNRSVEVSVASCLVVERVEDGKGRRAFLYGEPGGSARFGINQRNSRPQEVSNGRLFPGFAFSGT